MDLDDILHLLSQTRSIENGYYSDPHFENPMDDQQLPESLMDSFNIFQEIERNSDIIDLDDFKDILGDEDEMLDVYPSIFSNRERNNSDMITETKALLDLDESNVVLTASCKEDETNVQHIRKTDLFSNDNVSLDNARKIEIEIGPFPLEKTQKVYKESQSDTYKTSLPNFQDAFKIFVNMPFNKPTQEKVQKHYALQCDEVNTENLLTNPNVETGLKITNIDITDERGCDDIALVEEQAERYDSILVKNLMILDNDRATDDKFAKLRTYTTEYDSDCAGYHSSDFEFISEGEAEMDGLIVNDSKSKLRNKNNKAKTQTVKSENYNLAQNLLDEDNFRRHIGQSEEESGKEHKIPEGEEYLNLFQGNNEPTVPMYYMMENKSLGATSCMAIEYQGIGFDMRMMRGDDVDDELKEDAKRSVKKIFEMYPLENSKRKRRH